MQNDKSLIRRVCLWNFLKQTISVAEINAVSNGSKIIDLRAEPRICPKNVFLLVPSLGWVFKNGGQPGISMCIFNKYIFI